MLLDFKLPDGDGLDGAAPDQGAVARHAGHHDDRLLDRRERGRGDEAAAPTTTSTSRSTSTRWSLLVEKALETSQLRREVRALRSSQGKEFGFDAIIGESAAMKTAKALMARVAASPASTVLLTGETGTGKDLAAKAIHYNSGRAARQFVNITCSALPEQLLESELFGHERGAFTDARQQKRGLFETADGGTLFLDEIGEMTLALQSKLLRFLEEKAFKRVGGLSDMRVDVRVDRGHQPRPRRRGEGGQVPRGPVLPPAGDADPAAAAARAARRRAAAGGVLHRPVQYRVPQEACAGCRRRRSSMLEQYAWPGNIRELRNAIERAMLLTDRRPAGASATSRRSTRTVSPVQFKLPPEGRQHRGSGAPAAGAGARALEGQPDAGRAAARHQSRSGALPDREVRPAEGLTLPAPPARLLRCPLGHHSMVTEDQSDVVAFLGSPAAHGGLPVERIDTHASIVFLAGDRALKLKRAVRYDYLDFSTAEQRRAMCEAELRMNRRTAPALYRGVVRGDPRGRRSAGARRHGAAVDWVVEMARFDQDGLLDRLAERGALRLGLMAPLAAADRRAFTPAPGAGPTTAAATGMRVGGRRQRERIRERAATGILAPTRARCHRRRAPGSARTGSRSRRRRAGGWCASATAICISATSCCSTGSRRCSTPSSSTTRSRASTCCTTWRSC